jgi:uncharacterized membrane protein YccF (DUF307 family)
VEPTDLAPGDDASGIVVQLAFLSLVTVPFSAAVWPSGSISVKGFGHQVAHVGETVGESVELVLVGVAHGES